MHINIITPGALEKALRSEGRFGWLSHEDFLIPFSKTVLDGFEDHLKANYPECCSFHRNLSTNAFAYLDKFPYCCTAHTKLLSASWFKKENMVQGLAGKIIETARQTEVLIANKIQEPDWYEHITEFVEYAIDSFGQPPAGYGGPIGLPVYTSHLKQYFRVFKQIPREKSQAILGYLKSFESKGGPAKITDLNDINDVYQRWLAIFPWHISIFQSYKERLEGRMPFLAEEPQYNRYSGLSKARVIRVEELIKFLVDSTRMILATFNTRALKEKLDISDLELREIELINAHRDQELAQLRENITDERKKYLRILNQWYDGEQRYIKKLLDALTRREERKAKKQTRKNGTSRETDLHSLKNKFCPRMPISVVIDHFSKLVNHRSSNGNPFLKQEQLEDFIATAFGESPRKSKHKINFGRGEKGIIIGLFYSFYNMAVNELHEPTAQCKYKYVKLLTNHFEGWEEKKVSANFRPFPGPYPWD